MLKTIARAKINLALRILGKNETGFHLIESITAFSDFGDEVEIFTNSSCDQLEINGPFAKDLEGDNIVVKALEYFRKEKKNRRQVFMLILAIFQHSKMPSF